MSNPTAVARTAPIPIAPKPATSRSSVSLSSSASKSRQRRRQDSFNRLDSGNGSLPASGLARSSSFGGLAPPCEACRRVRMKCIVMLDDDDGCVSCQANGVDCSLVASPPARKRKLNGDSAEDASGKGRYVQERLFAICLSVYASVT